MAEPSVPVGEGAALLASTRAAMAAAEVAYAEADSRLEAALLSGVWERRQEALDRVEEAHQVLHIARSAWLRALRGNAPSFARLLTDQTTQPAGADAVMASILAYQNAPKGTAG